VLFTPYIYTFFVKRLQNVYKEHSRACHESHGTKAELGIKHFILFTFIFNKLSMPARLQCKAIYAYCSRGLKLCNADRNIRETNLRITAFCVIVDCPRKWIGMFIYMFTKHDTNTTMSGDHFQYEYLIILLLFVVIVPYD
jgi:hypothetical protein